MISFVILIFILGYLAIVFEHPLKLDKTVPALIMAAIIWAVLSLGFNMGKIPIVDTHGHLYDASNGLTETLSESFNNNLLHHIGKIAEIIIFLIGAMTIVEIIDLHRGFDVLKGYVKTSNKKSLLWISGIIAFILSAIIDNLTATIVLITLLRKLIKSKEDRLYFVSLIVIAANAGGAWSPIGDVTSTMLWIGKKVSALALVKWLLIPSIICFVLPYLIASTMPVFKGNLNNEEEVEELNHLLSSNLILWLGLGAIISVPIFKSIFHLPPYMGMILGMGIVWLVSEYIHPEENFDHEKRHLYSAHKALSRIELTSVLFFLGILLGVAALETTAFKGMSTLSYAAGKLDSLLPNRDFTVILLGILSAIIDNVPLVAASMGMFSEAIDSKLWHFIAYSAGTGGSMLVIGSAAGVAAMGMEKINFLWYLKKISWLAALGYFAGAVAFLIQFSLLGK